MMKKESLFQISKTEKLLWIILRRILIFNYQSSSNNNNLSEVNSFIQILLNIRNQYDEMIFCILCKKKKKKKNQIKFKFLLIIVFKYNFLSAVQIRAI